MALERVQRRATKFILKCDLTDPDRLVKLGLLSFELRREVLDLCFFFKWLVLKSTLILMFYRMLSS